MHSHVLGLDTVHNCPEIKRRNLIAIVQPVGGVTIAVTHASTTFLLSSVHSGQIGSASAKSCTNEMAWQAKMSIQVDEFSSNPMIP
jgi:hypothetical protein